jgi:hypothetical protein
VLRIGVLLLIVLSLISFWQARGDNIAQAALLNFTATLDGAQEVPPVTTPTTTGGAIRPAAFGTASFVLDEMFNTLRMTVTVFNIDCTGAQTPDPNDNLTAAHIHAGPAVTPATNGPVVWGFFGAPFNDNSPNDNVVTPFGVGVGCTIIGKWDPLEGNGTTLTAQIPNILAGRSYINFHTVQFGGGEIRGAILPAVALGVDFTASKSSSATTVTVNSPWTWTTHVSNAGNLTGTFATGQQIFRDNLPAGPAYSNATVANANGVTNSGSIACSVTASVLTCIAMAPVAFDAPSSIDFQVTATSAAAGTFVNPTGGICRADPDTAVIESNEGNNDCANTVTVSSAVVPTVLPTAMPTAIATAMPTVVAPVVPQVIPQVFQNPYAIPAIMGGIGDGTRNNTPIPARPVAVAPDQVAPLQPVLRPPSTGDAGLERRLGKLWRAF